MSLFIFVAFPYSAKATFVVVIIHIIDSDLYSIYNITDRMAESLYIIGVIILGFGVMAKLLYDLGTQIDDGLIELDEKLALAIRSVVEKIPGLGDSEPINPIQMAFAQLIGNMAQQKQVIIPPKIIERDENGLFTKQQ